MKNLINECRLKFPALSRNESLSRSAAAAFAMQCDPTAPEMAAIKTAVSEAVTNAIVHGYRNNRDNKGGVVEMHLKLFEGGVLHIQIKDKGCGISDVAAAMQPMFTTAPADEERSGLGFTVMESFMDKVRVRSAEGRGTTVTLEKRIAKKIGGRAR